MKFFQAVALQETFVEVSHALHVSAPAVSQRLTQLERKLQLQLVKRRQTGYTLTEAGVLLASRGAAVLAMIAGITCELNSVRGSGTEILRILAPLGFGQNFVAKKVISLRKMRPSLKIQLILLENPCEHLSKPDWDLIIYLGEARRTDKKQVNLGPNHRFLCASPKYLSKCENPSHPEQLWKHSCGVVQESKDVANACWRLEGQSGKSFEARFCPSFVCNDVDVVYKWALEGQGIIQGTEWTVSEEIKAGRLIRILPDWSVPDHNVLAVVNPAREGAHIAEDLLTIMKSDPHYFSAFQPEDPVERWLNPLC